MDPVTRLAQFGAEALDDAELVAVAVGLGDPGDAERLLRAAGGVDRLLRWETPLLRRHGLSSAAVAPLAASHELVIRAIRSEALQAEAPRRSGFARYIVARHWTPDQEVVGVFYLDLRHRVLAEEVVFRGALACSTVESRPILRGAVHYRAPYVLVWHTHPNGSLRPSIPDIEFTRRLGAACELIGVGLVDHLIIGGPSRWAAVPRSMSQ